MWVFILPEEVAGDICFHEESAPEKKFFVSAFWLVSQNNSPWTPDGIPGMHAKEYWECRQVARDAALEKFGR